MNMLNAAPEHNLPWRVFHTALSLEFPEDMAERQLDAAIGWGRYAELIDYDDSDETLSLDPSQGRAVEPAR
jgi:NitT/TauT family transport system ATP-binding protein